MDPVLYPVILVFGTLTGLAVGSFLNVVIHRLPRDESIVNPPSHCPHCDRPIRWYENLPVLSWLILRGRCAGCGAAISFRYVVVELLGAAAVLVPLLLFGVSWQAMAGVLLGWHLIALAGIDLETRLVPDALVISLGVLGLFVLGVGYGWGQVGTSLLSAAILSGFFALVRVLAKAWLGKEAMGGGDVTMAAAIGVFLPPLQLPLFLLVASASMLLASLVWAWAAKRSLQDVEIPFGPGLAFGAWLTFHLGDWMFRGMLALVGG